MPVLFFSVGCEKNGCTDSAAENYSPDATSDDGSCTYCLYCLVPDNQKTTDVDESTWSNLSCGLSSGQINTFSTGCLSMGGTVYDM
tara:strand:+ start:871 stop:1128 length:258 start_codon:yes stop_codon:yes gene_type:complete